MLALLSMLGLPGVLYGLLLSLLLARLQLLFDHRRRSDCGILRLAWRGVLLLGVLLHVLGE